jgi:excisionase family DNA binding protein
MKGDAMRTTKKAKEPATRARIESLWTIDETAAFLRVPVSTLYRWRTHQTGPAAFRVGRHLRYDPATVNAWLLDQVAA